jgi:hypothetical protein
MLVFALLADRRSDDHRRSRTESTADCSAPCASRNVIWYVPLGCTAAMTLTMAVPPSSAKRSAQLRTRKFVPSSPVRQ